MPAAVLWACGCASIPGPHQHRRPLLSTSTLLVVLRMGSWQVGSYVCNLPCQHSKRSAGCDSAASVACCRPGVGPHSGVCYMRRSVRMVAGAARIDRRLLACMGSSTCQVHIMACVTPDSLPDNVPASAIAWTNSSKDHGGHHAVVVGSSAPLGDPKQVLVKIREGAHRPFKAQARTNARSCLQELYKRGLPYLHRRS
jgi:hypothetical protein